MSRYTKQYYEDVALVLSEKRIYFSHLYNDAQAIVAEQVVDYIVHSLADLFAADNPPVCVRCRTPKTQARQGIGCRYADEYHKWAGGFDRKQFLEACGLEPEQHTIPKQILEHYGLSKVDQEGRG